MTAEGAFLVSSITTGGLLIVALVLGALRQRIATVVVAALAVIASIVVTVSNADISRGTSPIVVLAPALAVSLAAASIAMAFRTRGRVATAPVDAPLSTVSVAAIITVFVANLVGVVLGYLGLRDTAASTKRGRSLAQAAIVIGWIGLVIWTVVSSYLVWLALYGAGVIRY